jgi:hypothetical protein
MTTWICTHVNAAGLNDLFDYYVWEPDIAREWAYMLVGLIGVLLINRPEGYIDNVSYCYSTKWQNAQVIITTLDFCTHSWFFEISHAHSLSPLWSR